MAVWDPITTPLQVNPTTISKVNTALQFATLAVGIAHPVLVSSNNESAFFLVQLLAAEPVLPALCWLTGATTLASLGSYIGHSAFSEVVRKSAKAGPK